VTGVSGSGKSSLVEDILWKAAARALHRAQLTPGAHEAIEGLEQINKVISVDQAPLGSTPNSTPATYTGVFDLIRELFAKLPEAKVRGYSARRFSFNQAGGRCEACEGAGQKRIEMHFLPDVWITCDACGGTRYIPDEPTTGLHFDDVRKLLDVLHRLADLGNSVVVIEHNLDVIKTADWVIDLGPEAGIGGGDLVAEGNPEAIAENPRSHTGRFLKPVLAAGPLADRAAGCVARDAKKEPSSRTTRAPRPVPVFTNQAPPTTHPDPKAPWEVDGR